MVAALSHRRRGLVDQLSQAQIDRARSGESDWAGGVRLQGPRYRVHPLVSINCNFRLTQSVCLVSTSSSIFARRKRCLRSVPPCSRTISSCATTRSNSLRTHDRSSSRPSVVFTSASGNICMYVCVVWVSVRHRRVNHGPSIQLAQTRVCMLLLN